MKKLFLYLLSFSAIFCRAQQDLTQNYLTRYKECGGIEELEKKKGSWQKSKSGDNLHPDETLPRSHYSEIIKRIDNFLPLMKEASPELNGIEPRWKRYAGGNSIVSGGPVPYELTTSYFTYFCNTRTKQIMPGNETGTWAYIFVNHFNWFFGSYDEWDINNDGKPIRFYNTSPKIGEWKGMPLYQSYAHDKYNKAVLITHDGLMPWLTLTQKEYLTGLKNLLEMKKKQSGGRDNKFFDDKLKYVYDYLSNNTEETLSQPAIIDPKYGIEGFKGQFGDEKNKGTRLVRMSAKYFKKDLPRYMPQFMLLYWRWTEDPFSLSFKKQFEENFPVEKLKALLDK